MTSLYEFLFPQSPYYGKITPENLIFNTNLQEFAHKVSFISALETSGKISPQEAFAEIESLWEKLESCKKFL